MEDDSKRTWSYTLWISLYDILLIATLMLSDLTKLSGWITSFAVMIGPIVFFLVKKQVISGRSVLIASEVIAALIALFAIFPAFYRAVSYHSAYKEVLDERCRIASQARKELSFSFVDGYPAEENFAFEEIKWTDVNNQKCITWKESNTITITPDEEWEQLTDAEKYESLVSIYDYFAAQYNNYKVNSTYGKKTSEDIKRLTGQTITLESSLKVYADSSQGRYLMFDNKTLYKNSLLVYRKPEPVKKEPTYSHSSSSYSPSKKKSSTTTYYYNYTPRWTDPDDYDDPDEYAEDAWGYDFDDYDDAASFWEDW